MIQPSSGLCEAYRRHGMAIVQWQHPVAPCLKPRYGRNRISKLADDQMLSLKNWLEDCRTVVACVGGQAVIAGLRSPHKMASSKDSEVYMIWQPHHLLWTVWIALLCSILIATPPVMNTWAAPRGILRRRINQSNCTVCGTYRL